MTASGSTVDELGSGGLAVTRPSRLVRSRHRDRDAVLRRALLAVDMACLVVAMCAAFLVGSSHDAPLGAVLLLGATLPGWALLLRSYGLYARPLRRLTPSHLRDLPRIFDSLVVGSVGLWLLYKLAPDPWQPVFTEMLVFGTLALLLIVLLRAVTIQAHLRFRGPERVLAVASPQTVERLREGLRARPEYELAMVLPPDAELDATLASGQFDHVFLELTTEPTGQSCPAAAVRTCHRRGIRVSALPYVEDLFHPDVRVNHLEGMGILSLTPTE